MLQKYLCPNSTSTVYWLALHSLVNKNWHYYSHKTYLRDFFFADRSYLGKLFFYFLKLGAEGWGGDFLSLKVKENIMVKTPELQLKLHKQCLDLSECRIGHFPFSMNSSLFNTLLKGMSYQALHIFIPLPE